MTTSGRQIPPRRLWLVFFSDKIEPGYWWSPLLRVLRPGFRHVAAASWYADTQRWVFVLPTARGTVIEVLDADAAGPRFQQMIDDATAVLRIASAAGRTCAPLAPWCVGAVKALLGLRSRALSPWRLHQHLRAHGAKPIEMPHGNLQAQGACRGP